MFHSLLAQWHRTRFSEAEGIGGLYQKLNRSASAKPTTRLQNRKRAASRHAFCEFFNPFTNARRRVFYGVPCVVVGAKWRSSALVICSLGTAPTICSTTCPFLKTSSVGMPRML